LTHLFCDLILLDRDEIHRFVKVHFTKRCLLDHSMIELALDFHHEQQHVIVGPPREENLPGVQLVKGTPDGPDVNGCIIWQTEDWQNQQVSFHPALLDSLISGAL
jgi:hypothetical protein